jgi:acetyl esterase/lipase
MNQRILTLVILLAAALGVLWGVEGRGKNYLTPDNAGAIAHLDIEYGPHERNRLDVYTPSGDGPYPVVIWLHPGGWLGGDKSLSMPVWNWTDRGYAIVSVNYRYAIAPDTVADSVSDALAAVQYVLDHHDEWDLDADRVGIYGFSAGGHLAAMVAHEDSPVRAIAIAGAPTDFAPLLDPAVTFFDGNEGPDVVSATIELLGCTTPSDCVERAMHVSPAQLDPGSVDLLIVHGNDDHIVHVDNARRLADHLRAQGVQPTLVIVQGGRHEPLVDEGGIAKFLDERLLS